MESKVDHGKTLDYLTVYPDGYAPGKAYPLVILMHGFGANKEDLSGLAPALDRTGYLYIFPDAPLIVGDDPATRAWHERGGKEGQDAVREAMTAIDGFVKEVVARFRVQQGQAVLAGFSQGGAMSLRYGLPRPDLFAGIGVLSGSLRRVDDLRAELPIERKQPIFVAHGEHDAMVEVKCSQDLVAFLGRQGYQPVYKIYPIGHEISPALVADFRAWIKQVLPSSSPD
jgi:phospholipase/carboxylesterase